MPEYEATLLEYSKTDKANAWEPAKHWSKWWTRPSHLRMLNSTFSAMDGQRFNELPTSTNAVESLNKTSKKGDNCPLQLAIMQTYKTDMASALEHIAAAEGLPTTYNDMSTPAQEKRANQARLTRRKRQLRDGSSDGPPDKSANFNTPRKRRKTSMTQGKENKPPEEEETDNKEVDNRPNKKLSKYHFEPTIADFRRIESGQWLQMEQIYLATQLVKARFPEQEGLLCTLALQKPSKLPKLPQGSIQIHHVNGNHWVTSMHCGSYVKVYDSLYSGVLANDLQTQLLALYSTEGRSLEVRVQRVQQQQGGADCGLFSIAYAHCLAAGEDPTKMKFKQPEMRRHLSQCLRNNLITNFPVDRVVTRAARPDVHILI